MRKLLILLGVVLVSVHFVQIDNSHAETQIDNSHSQADAQTIGYVNFAKIFEGYKRVEESNAKLDERKKAVREQLAEMQDLQKKYDLTSVQERSDIEKQLTEKQDYIREETLQVRKDEDRILKEIMQEIENASGEIRNSLKLDYILDDRLILSGPDSMDLTEDIIKLLNESYK